MKSVIVGISVTPELGLEVAQIDFNTQTVLKYGVKPLEYDTNRQEIADLDIFKETLQDLLIELAIPKNAQFVINLPTSMFDVKDYPASLTEPEIMMAIEGDFAENSIYKETEPCIAAASIPSSSIQFSKIAYTASSRLMISEIAMTIKSLGYKLLAIDTSVNTVLNALIYNERVNATPNTNWVMLMVDNSFCRVILMNGTNYVDSFEERIRIGEVLGDSENYATVINAVQPILKNAPANYLCVVSKTNIISAEILANKIQYSSPIIYQEANNLSREAFLSLAPEISPDLAPSISLDIIGACLYAQKDGIVASLNLFNKSLGDIYILEQPPEITIGGRTYILTNEFLIRVFVVLFVLLAGIAIVTFAVCSSQIASLKQKTSSLQSQIVQANKFLEENNRFSSNLFDEGDEIKRGLQHNKNIYSYYTIVGTEIPKKLWLTHLKFSDKVTIAGQSDNLESVYSFFRNIKDYDPESTVKLQRLGLAAKSKMEILSDDASFDTDSILTSMNADFYEFKISNEEEVKSESINDAVGDATDLPAGLEPIKENK